MVYPSDDKGTPRSLKPEDTQPTVPEYDPKVPLGFQPVDKKDAQANVSTAQTRYEQWRSSLLQSGTPIKVTSDVVYIWDESKEEAVKPAGISDEDWAFLQAAEGGSDGPSGKWIPDPNGQQFYDDWQQAIDISKGEFASSGSAKSYADIEAPKSKEIQRQWKDFEDRATAFYDLQADEQAYGMRADDQNWQNMDAQRDLGMASMGYYTKPTMENALSNIVGPSIPNYVRPDYRLNASVGLPGPQGFDDPDYDENGFPRFAFGTDPKPPMDRIVVPRISVPWPWGGA